MSYHRLRLYPFLLLSHHLLYLLPLLFTRLARLCKDQGRRSAQPRLSLTTRAAIVEWTAAPPSPSLTQSPLSPLASSSPPPLPTHFGPSHKRSHPSPSPSIGPSRTRCRSPSPSPSALAELALAAPALPSIPIDLLPPHKRFGAIERIEIAKRERSSH
ncbi:hypothetical protein Tco_1541316 [Tanacetum coccineum]